MRGYFMLAQGGIMPFQDIRQVGARTVGFISITIDQVFRIAETSSERRLTNSMLM